MVALEEAADVDDLMKKNEKVVKAVKLLLSRVQGLSDSMADVKSDLVLVGTEQGAPFATQDTGPEDTADDLMDFIMPEEKAVIPERRSTGSVAGGSHTKTYSDDEDHEGSIKSVLSKLIEDVRLLQSSTKQTASINFAGLGFTDPSECSAWIAKHYSGLQYGFIMDPLTHSTV